MHPVADTPTHQSPSLLPAHVASGSPEVIARFVREDVGHKLVRLARLAASVHMAQGAARVKNGSLSVNDAVSGERA